MLRGQVSVEQGGNWTIDLQGEWLQRGVCGWPEQGNNHAEHHGPPDWLGSLEYNQYENNHQYENNDKYNQVMVLNKVSCELIVIVVQCSVSIKGVKEDEMMEDEALSKAVASFRYVKCNYGRHETAEGFLYETLSQGLGIAHHYIKIQQTIVSICINHRPLLVLSPLPVVLPGLANRTAEKTKPSALDMLLVFKESIRIKQSSTATKKGALRDLLFASVADYNKTVNNHRAPCLTLFSLVSILKWYIYGIFHGPKSKAQSKAWRVGDSTRKLIYNLLRSPKGLLDALKACYNESKPEHAGWVFFSNI